MTTEMKVLPGAKAPKQPKQEKNVAGFSDRDAARRAKRAASVEKAVNRALGRILALSRIRGLTKEQSDSISATIVHAGEGLAARWDHDREAPPVAPDEFRLPG